MDEIRLRFVRGSAWDSRVIEYQTRAWCSHAEAVWDLRETLGAMLNGGVLVRSVDDRAYRGVVRAETWAIPCQGPQAEKFGTFLDNQIGKPYDWRAILSFGLGERDWRAPDSWFCSELQAAALEAAGLLTMTPCLPVSRITPRDLFMLVSQIPGAHRV